MARKYSKSTAVSLPGDAELATVLAVTATEPNTFGNFATVASGHAGDSIDELVIASPIRRPAVVTTRWDSTTS